MQPGIGRVVAFEAPDHQLQAGHVPCSVGMEPLLEDLLCHQSGHTHGLGAIRLRQRRDKQRVDVAQQLAGTEGGDQVDQLLPALWILGLEQEGAAQPRQIGDGLHR